VQEGGLARLREYVPSSPRATWRVWWAKLRWARRFGPIEFLLRSPAVTKGLLSIWPFTADVYAERKGRIEEDGGPSAW